MTDYKFLSQDEINQNAVEFSKKWKDKKDENEEFIDEFFKVFGLTRNAPSNLRDYSDDLDDYSWSKISSTIFNNTFQTVVEQDAHRGMDTPYNSEENILRVIRPLFLDELNMEFNQINIMAPADDHIGTFLKFQNKLSNLKFLDPACGSGNFLIVAYREIRKIEHKIIMKTHNYDVKNPNTRELSKIGVNQLYGIESDRFSARISEAVLCVMEQVMNNELGGFCALGLGYIPAMNKPFIINENALKFNCNELLPATECNYILGNPSFNNGTWKDRYQKK